AMGGPMAANLARAGRLEAVWNRTPERAEAFCREHGVPPAADPEELARRCALVLISVSADQDLDEVVGLLLPGLGRDNVVVDTSTVSANTARRIAAAVEDTGARFLDAPVSGGVEGARRGTLAMMVGGDAAALERVRPLLEQLARQLMHMGPVGAGQSTKAVNQIMAAGINQAVTEALAFGRAEGLDLDRVIQAIGGGAAGNWFLEHRGAAMVRGSYEPGFRVALHYKDLAICQTMTARHGITLPVIESTLSDYESLIAQGRGDEDISALYRLKRGLFGIDE
ncbi:MAG: NAD(P)-dependent oxidoreductase, partial [Chromatiales bacterium]